MTAVVRLRNVLIPTQSRRAARAGVALLTFSKPLPLACHRLLDLAVGVAGPRILPGARFDWSPPEVLDQVTEVVGPVDGIAVYERPQASRSGLAAVLLRAGRPVAFLKLRYDSDALERERVALGAFGDGRPTGFRVPRPLGHGENWILLEAMPPRPTRPWRHPPIDTITGEITDRLATVLPRPPGVADHWAPMHGDLTAWNLRAAGRQRWLIDWEDAAWAPPGADRVYYAATMGAVFGVRTGGADPEAVQFWLDRVSARAGTDHDAALNARLISTLHAMREWDSGGEAGASF
jgi:Phosphotransferase enzyme family